VVDGRDGTEGTARGSQFPERSRVLAQSGVPEAVHIQRKVVQLLFCNWGIRPSGTFDEGGTEKASKT